MKQKTDRAYLLRSVNYGESDRIVTLLLEEGGKTSALAKGARKSWRRFGGALELFSLFEVSLVKGRGNLKRLDEARLITPHHDMAKDLQRMSAASFVVELVRELVPEDEPAPEIFSLMGESFESLENTSEMTSRIVALAAELQLLNVAGIGVSLDRCNACGRAVPENRPVKFHPSRGGVVCTPCGGGPILLTKTIIAQLIRLEKTNLGNCSNVELDDETLIQCEGILSDFIYHHLGKEVRMKIY